MRRWRWRAEIQEGAGRRWRRGRSFEAPAESRRASAGSGRASRGRAEHLFWRRCKAFVNSKLRSAFHSSSGEFLGQQLNKPLFDPPSSI
jgi:hypothetical protein